MGVKHKRQRKAFSWFSPRRNQLCRRQGACEFDSHLLHMIFTTKDDYKKFYLETPDPGFSPAKNKAVIENSIKKYEAMQKAKRDKFNNDTLERADAIATYFKVIRQGKRMDLRKFFTKKYLAYLRGEEIRQEYMAKLKFAGKKRDQILNLN